MAKSLTINLLLTIMLVFLGCKKDDTKPTNTDFDPHTMGDYFVSPDGDDDNPGTYEEPFATWQKGFETAIAGDTVYFRGGVWYPETTYSFTSAVVFISPYGDPKTGHDGTSTNPICMFAYPGETPILDCRKVPIPQNFLSGIGIDRCNYLHIRGLTIRNVLPSRPATLHGFITGQCSNLTCENLTVYNIGGKGIVNYSNFKNAGVPEQANIQGDTTKYINCDASFCMDSLSRVDGATDLGNYADGFWLNIINSESYVIMEGCRSWTNSDDGYDLPTSGILIMNNCWAWDNGHLVGGAGEGIRNDPASNPVDMGWTISNCISALNKAAGFTIGCNGCSEREVFFYNNFSYHNNYGLLINGQDTTMGRQDRFYHNNIIYNNETFDEIIVMVPNHYSNNFWGTKIEKLGQDMTIPDHSPAVTVTDDDFQSLDVSQLSKPRKSDGSLPTITFSRLKIGSDLIGAGTYVGMSATPDIGIDWNFIDTQLKF